MPDIWTHGTWTVRAGREDDVVHRRRAMARLATSELAMATKPTLLLDCFESRTLDEVELDG
jgi:hypothetical protein